MASWLVNLIAEVRIHNFAKLKNWGREYELHYLREIGTKKKKAPQRE